MADWARGRRVLLRRAVPLVRTMGVLQTGYYISRASWPLFTEPGLSFTSMLGSYHTLVYIVITKLLSKAIYDIVDYIDINVVLSSRVQIRSTPALQC